MFHKNQFTVVIPDMWSHIIFSNQQDVLAILSLRLKDSLVMKRQSSLEIDWKINIWDRKLINSWIWAKNKLRGSNIDSKQVWQKIIILKLLFKSSFFVTSNTTIYGIGLWNFPSKWMNLNCSFDANLLFLWIKWLSFLNTVRIRQLEDTSCSIKPNLTGEKKLWWVLVCV